MVAQAEAAHNQAILAGLNEFTHLEPNKHRWDVSATTSDLTFRRRTMMMK